MSRRHRFESKALQWTYDRYIGKDPRRRALFEDALANASVARSIYDARTEAGLTQAKLAERVGTSVSAISRIEDLDYDRHSLSILRRIAAALNMRVEVRFVPIRTRAARAPRRLKSTRATAATSRSKKKVAA